MSMLLRAAEDSVATTRMPEVDMPVGVCTMGGAVTPIRESARGPIDERGGKGVVFCIGRPVYLGTRGVANAGGLGTARLGRRRRDGFMLVVPCLKNCRR